MMPDRDHFLFVSHVSEDRPAALEIVDELERRGIPCWIAPRDVHPGKPFDDEIAEAIEACRAMLLVFSEHCNENEYIRREITVAGESQKIIIPFRIENAQPRRGLRVRLSDLHWIDGFVSRERAIDQVVRTIDPDWTRRQEQERRRAEERQRAHEQRRIQEEAEQRRQQEAEEQQLRQQQEEQRRRQEEEKHRQREEEQRRQHEAEEEQSRLRAEEQRREQPPEERPLPERMVEVRPRMQRALGRRSIAIASAAAVAVVALVTVFGGNQYKKYIYAGIPGFFENFTSFKLNPIWVASLPNAIWRSQPGAGIAHFAGSPHYSFERLGGSSVLRLTNMLHAYPVDTQAYNW
jgi:hypothetical protein